MRSRILPTITLAFGVALLSVASAQAQPEGQPCAPEPTDQLVAYGDRVNACDINPIGDSDLFRFQGSAGEVVVVRVSDHETSFFEPACGLELFRPTGTLITSASSANICEIRVKLDASGLFTIRVTEFQSSQLMTYTVWLDRLSPPSPTATSINPGNTIIGERIDPKGDTDLFIFNGVQGDVISLRMTDQETAFFEPAAGMELFGPDGMLVTSASAAGTATIDVTLNQTGVFTVRASEFQSTATMTYNLEYQCLIGTCPSYHTLTVGRTGSGAVTSSPIGIECGTDCSERYFVGTVVTLTPTPNASWAFSTWGGNADCADGVVTMTAEISCVATFVPLPTAPLVTLDKTSLRFGAVTNGVAFLSQTAPQIVRLTQTGTGTVTWTAISEPAVAAGQSRPRAAVRQSVGQRRGGRRAAGGQHRHRGDHVDADGRVEHGGAHHGLAEPPRQTGPRPVRSASWIPPWTTPRG